MKLLKYPFSILFIIFLLATSPTLKVQTQPDSFRNLNPRSVMSWVQKEKELLDLATAVFKIHTELAPLFKRYKREPQNRQLRTEIQFLCYRLHRLTLSDTISADDILIFINKKIEDQDSILITDVLGELLARMIIRLKTASVWPTSGPLAKEKIVRYLFLNLLHSWEQKDENKRRKIWVLILLHLTNVSDLSDFEFFESVDFLNSTQFSPFFLFKDQEAPFSVWLEGADLQATNLQMINLNIFDGYKLQLIVFRDIGEGAARYESSRERRKPNLPPLSQEEAEEAFRRLYERIAEEKLEDPKGPPSQEGETAGSEEWIEKEGLISPFEGEDRQDMDAFELDDNDDSLNVADSWLKNQANYKRPKLRNTNLQGSLLLDSDISYSDIRGSLLLWANLEKSNVSEVLVGQDPDSVQRTRLFEREKDRLFPREPDKLFDIVKDPFPIWQDRGIQTAI